RVVIAYKIVNDGRNRSCPATVSPSYMQSLPDFVRLAEAYGHVGIQISHPHELESKLSEALEQVRNNRLVFVDVTVDGSEHVYPMQIRGGGMDEMWLSKTERT
ncbi:thiamine pyrophosphate-dependent enzyme, partial [Escherichia sp. HC-CC]